MNRNSHPADGIIGALTSKPEAWLLLAAGAALMLRSGGTVAATARSVNSGRSRRKQAAPDDAAEDSSWGFEGSISAAADRTKEAFDKGRDYVSDVAGRTADAAGDLAGSVADYAGQARRGVVDGSIQAADTIQETAQRVARQHPLSVALVGLAAGAAIAAAFPVTRAESNVFAPARQKLADAVSEAGAQLKSASARATERLAEVADERGLDRDGLKEAAGEVAEAFGTTSSGREGQGKRTGRSGDDA